MRHEFRPQHTSLPSSWSPLTVRLDDDERVAYAAAQEPFLALSRAFRRAHGPGGEWRDLASHLGKTREGRAALAGWHRARSIAALPRAKLRLVGDLLERSRDRKARPCGA